MRAGVLVPAAGRGVRLGGGTPKALRALGGVPMLVHSVRAMVSVPGVGVLVVAAPDHEVENVRALLARSVPATGTRVLVVAGGATRQESVACALAALPDDCPVVLVHDAARPFVPARVVRDVIAAVESGADAVVPVVPVVDTIKEVLTDRITEVSTGRAAAGQGPAAARTDSPQSPGVAGERVLRTIDRSTLRAVQTPQGFRREVLQAAHTAAQAGATPEGGATDDAGIVEALGGSVLAVPGSEEAFKVTRPFDLLVAEALVASREQSATGAETTHTPADREDTVVH